MSKDLRRRRRAPEASERQHALEHALGTLTREQLDALKPEDLAGFTPPLPEVHSRTEREADPIDSRLSKLDPTRRVGRVRSEQATYLGAVDALEQHDARCRQIRESIHDARAKVASITERVKSDGATALLAGKSAPDNGAARKKIAAEVERIEASEAALELAEPLREGLVAAERVAFADLCDQVHDLVGADTLADLQRAKRALAAMAPVLSRLWSNDIVRERLLGAKWSFKPESARPISGAIVVRGFLDAVPSVFGVSELDESALRSTAERMAAKMLADIQKEDRT